MFVCLLIAAVSFHYIPIDLHTLSVTTDNVGWPGTLVLVTIIIYVGFYSKSPSLEQIPQSKSETESMY